MSNVTYLSVNPQTVSRFKRTSTLLISALALTGCFSLFEGTPKHGERATLGDLAAKSTKGQSSTNQSITTDSFSETQANLTLAQSKADRTAKLAQIYQQLLTLEPNPEVRTSVEYRLAQLNTETYENQAFDEPISDTDESIALTQLTQNDQKLQQLVDQYQDLLQRFPDRADNEHVRYQLAKALDLQGKLDQSLAQIELLIQGYPQTQYLAELSFRRGEIYYNLQDYAAAISAYKQVIQAPNNDKYLVNSLYMTGWALFKQNRLPEADIRFIQVLDTMITMENKQEQSNEFTFAQLSSRNQNLAIDTQRVLSISLSQQLQSESLVSLVQQSDTSKNLPLFQHLLFENLANLLITKELSHDAALTYQAYIGLEKNNIWAARFSLALLDIYHRQGKFAAMHKLKKNYVEHFGVSSEFWQQANQTQKTELLPQLLSFSDEHSRRIYANAQQQQAQTSARQQAFAAAADALVIYLNHAKLPSATALLKKDVVNDEFLLGEAYFEAKQYSQALTTYEHIAYSADVPEGHQSLKLQSAYATTITIREMLAQMSAISSSDTKDYDALVNQRNNADKRFIEHYPDDERSMQLAIHAAQYAFDNQDYSELKQLTEFVLSKHGIDINSTDSSQSRNTNLSASSVKQVQVVSQLYANSLYKQTQYQAAESAYSLSLTYADQQHPSWQEMRDLLASSIYFQAQAQKDLQPELAVSHLLRVSQMVPESNYGVTAEFDAVNLLMEQQNWQQAIDVMLQFKSNYPKHEYSSAITAKLAQSYEALEQWDLAAVQLLNLADNESSEDLKREAQYTAAEYFAKAGDQTNAIKTFEHYVKKYPEPFDVAQEVRFKISVYYDEYQRSDKRFDWYREMLQAHQSQLSSAITPRSNELASKAAFELAKQQQQAFIDIKLVSPLAQSLKRKQAAMKQAIGYFQQVMDLQQAQHVPEATYHLAEMYRQLATDIMSSEPPQDLDELALEEYIILLEELAYPFEEKAIDIHVSNTERAWQNIYDEWVAKSFAKLAEISPALYKKQEITHDVIDTIY